MAQLLLNNRKAENEIRFRNRPGCVHRRREIVASHRHIFTTIYAGSRNQITLEAARMLSEGVALVHARCVLDAPTGPLAGQHQARFSAVLLSQDGRWRITSFHITLAPSAVT